MDQQQEASDEIFKAINHPLRRQILYVIKERGTVSFSELIEEMQLEVGTFYYHLDLLKPLIMQTEERHYQLSPTGMDVFDIMRQLEQSRPHQKTKHPLLQKLEKGLKQIIAPSALFRHIAKRPRRFLFEAVVLVFINGLIVAAVGLQPFIFYVTSTPTPNFLITLVTFISGWIATFLVIEGLMRLLFHNSHGTEVLLVLTAFIRLPVLLYAGLWFFRDSLFWIPPLGWLIIQFGTELWSIWLAIVITSNAKLARPEQATVAVFIFRFAIIIIYGLFVFLIGA